MSTEPMFRHKSVFNIGINTNGVLIDYNVLWTDNCIGAVDCSAHMY